MIAVNPNDTLEVHIGTVDVATRYWPMNEVRMLNLTDAIGGTFKLEFDTDPDDALQGSSTTALPFNATSAEIQKALELVTEIGTGNVQVSGSRGVHRITFV